MSVPLLTTSLETLITKESGPVVIEFFATWCPKCSMMASVFDRLACQLSDRIKFYKIDIDISEKESQSLGIEIVPTFLFYNNHKIVGYTVGVLSESTLKTRILDSITV